MIAFLIAYLAPLTFLGVPLLLYLAQGYGVYLPNKRVGMAIAMTGYALGNVGLFIDHLERTRDGNS